MARELPDTSGFMSLLYKDMDINGTINTGGGTYVVV